jgi:hypothetical protein
MSTLLEQASLIMIPSGYKEDVVYSVIPETGAGDLSFTRASNGTRINSAGLVEVVPWNLLEQSNSFSTSPWAMNVTSGQAGKDGQNNAWLLTKIGASTSDLYNSNIYNGDQTFTIYVKKESGKGFKLFPIGTTTAYTEVNLQTGAVYFSTAGITSTTVEAYSSTWWKISVALNMINSNYYIYVTDGAGTQIASSITIQDAQVNIGLTAKPYFPTTDRLNVPRLTYQNGGGGCPSLLLEKQSTNLLSYSEQFNNAYWEVGGAASVTANTTTSPDGTQNADTLTANGTGSIFVRNNVYGGTGTTCSNSVFAKKNNNRYVGLRNSGTTSAHDVFDFDTETWTNNSGAVLSYDVMGNGWYRLKSVNTDAVNLNYYWSVIPAVSTAGTESTTASNLTVYIWGGQAEQSSYPTSYIPTTSASATRVADACSKTGISSLIGQTEGTIFVDINNQLVNPGLDTRIQLSDGSTNNWIFLGLPDGGTGGLVRCYVLNVATSFNMSFYSSSALAKQRYKIAFAYKSGSFALYINGVLEGSSSTTGTMPSCSVLAIGGATPTSITQDSIQEFNQVTLFPTRLTNAELASLTTL